ncbi:MAG: ATPase, T2SS/T4P/T4SS family [Ndongobacter sp.]|nr:ATPase, T2SS/T4P/T4SS family [Ndongobacter sp.]
MDEQRLQEEVIQLREEIISAWSLAQLSDEKLHLMIDRLTRQKAERRGWSIRDASKIAEAVYAGVRGLEILEELLRDDEVNEVMVNAYDCIFVERAGVIERSVKSFSSKERYEDIIQRIVSGSGREVHQRSPIVDCRLYDGSRVNVVLHPIAERGSCLTIRRFRKKRYSIDDLVENGTLTEDAAGFLMRCVRARYNLFLSGGTGTGKTTFLNALTEAIPREERLITIEDARELDLPNRENWIALESRNANAFGEGEITIRQLIRAALRMRPDRIIVGEVRGPEAIDMLQALNTGHDGSISTGHANSILDMQYRLETMVLSGNPGLPIEAVRQQIGSAIEICVHLARLRDHRRRVVAIDEVLSEGADIVYYPLFRFREDATGADGTPGSLVACGELNHTAKLRSLSRFDSTPALSQIQRRSS